GTNKFDFIFCTDGAELGVFREKTISRMYGMGIGNFGSSYNVGNIQIGTFAWRRTYTHRFIGKTYVQTFAVGSRINSNRFDAHFLACANDSQSYFTTVG